MLILDIRIAAMQSQQIMRPDHSRKLHKEVVMLNAVNPSDCIQLTVHCSRLHHTCSFSVWFCGSHFSLFQLWAKYFTFSWWQYKLILTIKYSGYVEKQNEGEKVGAVVWQMSHYKVLYTYSPESQNGPCFVWPASSLICIKTLTELHGGGTGRVHRQESLHSSFL